MKIEQIYTGCLAQGAYYIESENEVAIIDPLREVNQYIDKAKESNSTIKYIFETHFHADFVSGHITLSKKTGGKIVYGPTAETNFDSIKAEDGEIFKIGNIFKLGFLKDKFFIFFLVFLPDIKVEISNLLSNSALAIGITIDVSW